MLTIKRLCYQHRFQLNALKRRISKETEFYPFNPTDWEEGNQFLKNAQSICLGLFKDNKLVGQAAWLIPFESTMGVVNICLLKEYCSQGYGTSLLRNLLSFIDHDKMITYLIVDLKNKRAAASYRKIGFKLWSEVDKQYYGLHSKSRSDIWYMKLI